MEIVNAKQDAPEHTVKLVINATQILVKTARLATMELVNAKQDALESTVKLVSPGGSEVLETLIVANKTTPNTVSN